MVIPKLEKDPAGPRLSTLSLKNANAGASELKLCDIVPFGPLRVTVSCAKPLPVVCGFSNATLTERALKVLLSICHVAESVTLLLVPPPLLLEYALRIVMRPSMTLLLPLKYAAAFGLPDKVATTSAFMGEPVAKTAACLPFVRLTSGAAVPTLVLLSATSVPLPPLLA